MTVKQEKKLLKSMLLEGITSNADLEEMGFKMEKLLELGVDNKKVSMIMLAIEYFRIEDFNF